MLFHLKCPIKADMKPQTIRWYFRRMGEPTVSGGPLCRKNQQHVYRIRRKRDGRCAQCIHSEDEFGRSLAVREGRPFKRDQVARRRVRIAHQIGAIAPLNVWLTAP